MKLYGQYSGKHSRRVPKRVQRRRQRQFITLLVSLLLVFGIAVGGTVAFITTQTEKKTNTFSPAQVSCEVTEEFNGTLKNNVAVKNTGNTDAYVRATVNITWMKNTDAGDQTVTARVPQEGVDYKITYLEDTGWIKGTDGYWYYQTPIAPDAVTSILIESCEQLEGTNVPDGYHLCVEIVASAIQSSPKTVVSAEWKVTIDNDGKIASANGSGVTGE